MLFITDIFKWLYAKQEARQHYYNCFAVYKKEIQGGGNNLTTFLCSPFRA